MTEKYLLLNGKKFYYDEIATYSFRNSIPINGYESKTLEFCRNWLNGVQEFPVQTSGSTGIPKSISLTREQLEASARRTIGLLHLQAGDQVLVCLNTEYIAGMMMLVRSFVADMQLNIQEPSGNPLAQLPDNVAVDFASFVPLQLQNMLHETPDALHRLSRMKGILVGGAPVSPGLQQALQQVQAPVYLTYGMTETASHVAVRRLNGPEATDEYQVFEGIEIGTDSRNCLTIKGDITKQELLTTNDVVELLSPDRFRWIGRADNTINSGGVKVQVEKVELAVATALLDWEHAPRFFIAPQPDQRLGQRVVLVLEGAPLDKKKAAALLQRIAENLPKYEQPQALYFSPAFAETATGKLLRQQTLEKLGLSAR
ncbi:AMP-binding protein [Pontibacter chitinilyticus]|uniref:AMP-binding protein n=1 Tax=Pontibacter chitinilyticus TaxID=2674989 RepID=UPI00321C205E